MRQRLNVLGRGIHNQIAAFDVPGCWDGPERFPAYLVDEEVQLLGVIDALIRT